MGHRRAVPWRESRVLDQRQEFVRRAMAHEHRVAELCVEYGISRKTGYKWLQRFLQGGLPNLADRSRTPQRVAYRVSDEVVQQVIELRQRHRFWGPKKLRAWLQQRWPATAWPAASTIGELLRRRGLIEPQRPRRRTPLSTQPLAACTESNVVWCADFKGCFRVGGKYCHPLTITDGYSRYLLRCQAMDGEQHEPVQKAFEQTFQQYGLPLRIRTDNGAPFASRAVAGLSRLSVWWIKLGITPERIEPGQPQQNGRHERMHRTLKLETAKPPQSHKEAQQQTFDDFVKTYNEERPHQALGQRTPASQYVPSPRAMPAEACDPEYPDDFEVRRIDGKGQLRWRSATPCLGTVLAHEAVGLEPVDDGRYQLWFGPIYLGSLIEGAKGQHTLLKNTPAASR